MLREPSKSHNLGKNTSIHGEGAEENSENVQPMIHDGTESMNPTSGPIEQTNGENLSVSSDNESTHENSSNIVNTTAQEQNQHVAGHDPRSIDESGAENHVHTLNTSVETFISDNDYINYSL